MSMTVGPGPVTFASTAPAAVVVVRRRADSHFGLPNSRHDTVDVRAPPDMRFVLLTRRAAAGFG